MFWIPNQLEGAYMGQDVTLECHSEAFPPSINYWEKEDGNTLISGEWSKIDSKTLDPKTLRLKQVTDPMKISYNLNCFQNEN